MLLNTNEKLAVIAFEQAWLLQIAKHYLLSFHLFNLCHRHPTGDVIGATENHFTTNLPFLNSPTFLFPSGWMMLIFPETLPSLTCPANFVRLALINIPLP